MKEIHITIEPDFTDCQKSLEPHKWSRADAKTYGEGCFICATCDCLDWFEDEERDYFEAYDSWYDG